MNNQLPIEAKTGSAAETPLDEERKSIPLGFFGRTPPFTKRQRRVFLIATTAGFFDQYDRALLTLALKQIQKGLQISEQALGNLLTLIRLGYIGSLLVTPLADVFGRRRLLLYTIVAYTLFTGLAAIAPTAHFFVACEMLARVFAGTEGTVALVILSEEVDAGVRGWAIGLLSALTSVGFGIAALVFAGIKIVPYAITDTRRDVEHELFVRLQKHYDDDTIAELTMIITWENASSRFNRAFRIPSQCFWKP